MPVALYACCTSGLIRTARGPSPFEHASATSLRLPSSALDRIELRVASRAPGVSDGPCGPETGVDGRCWPVVGGCRRRVNSRHQRSQRTVRCARSLGSLDDRPSCACPAGGAAMVVPCVGVVVRVGGRRGPGGSRQRVVDGAGCLVSASRRSPASCAVGSGPVGHGGFVAWSRVGAPHACVDRRVRRRAAHVAGPRCVGRVGACRCARGGRAAIRVAVRDDRGIFGPGRRRRRRVTLPGGEGAAAGSAPWLP